MVLYTLSFVPDVPQELRHKIASNFESLHWEVERIWNSNDTMHTDSFSLDGLNITCWDSNAPKLPSLPDGCLLKKL